VPGASAPTDSDDAAVRAASLQAAYYLPTAVAPFVSRRAFESVTGPKTEWWLVQTVAVLVGVVGGVLATAARRGRVTPEVAALGVGSAVGLAVIDVAHVARGRISPVYLVDAAVELLCVEAWRRAARGNRGKVGPTPSL
jgi:hypothetical protein